MSRRPGTAWARVAALFALLATVPASAEAPLWSAKAKKPCSLVLELPAGDLELRRKRGDAQVVAEPGQWTVDAVAENDALHMRVAIAEGHAAGDASPVRLELPRHCALAVRGGTGRIDIHGRHAAPLEVETTTGEIVLWAESGADLRVDLATSGEMGTDYSIAIEHRHHREPDKHGVVVLGTGDIAARLASRRGPVSVLARERANGH